MSTKFNLINVKIKLYKLYYKYIDTSNINHYKLLLLTEEYRQITTDYFNKYPTAEGWINLNKDLFNKNKQAEIDYIASSKRQSKIKNNFFENRDIICKNCKNKEYIICSNFFQNFYVNCKYHYEQSTEHIISDIMKDIKKDMQNMNKDI
jgi:hypothetical protein